MFHCLISTKNTGKGGRKSVKIRTWSKSCLFHSVVLVNEEFIRWIIFSTFIYIFIFLLRKGKGSMKKNYIKNSLCHELEIEIGRDFLLQFRTRQVVWHALCDVCPPCLLKRCLVKYYYEGNVLIGGFKWLMMHPSSPSTTLPLPSNSHSLSSFSPLHSPYPLPFLKVYVMVFF